MKGGVDWHRLFDFYDRGAPPALAVALATQTTPRHIRW
jgi:hypothetical protein